MVRPVVSGWGFSPLAWRAAGCVRTSCRAQAGCLGAPLLALGGARLGPDALSLRRLPTPELALRLWGAFQSLRLAGPSDEVGGRGPGHCPGVTWSPEQAPDRSLTRREPVLVNGLLQEPLGSEVAEARAREAGRGGRPEAGGWPPRGQWPAGCKGPGGPQVLPFVKTLRGKARSGSAAHGLAPGERPLLLQPLHATLPVLPVPKLGAAGGRPLPSLAEQAASRPGSPRARRRPQQG